MIVGYTCLPWHPPQPQPQPQPQLAELHLLDLSPSSSARRLPSCLYPHSHVWHHPCSLCCGEQQGHGLSPPCCPLIHGHVAVSPFLLPSLLPPRSQHRREPCCRTRTSSRSCSSTAAPGAPCGPVYDEPVIWPLGLIRGVALACPNPVLPPPPRSLVLPERRLHHPLSLPLSQSLPALGGQTTPQCERSADQRAWLIWRLVLVSRCHRPCLRLGNRSQHAALCESQTQCGGWAFGGTRKQTTVCGSG